jgi:hypothetical protein
MGELTALIVVIILITVSLMLFFVRRIRAGVRFGLRPLRVPEQLHKQVGQAAESGGLLHLTLGRAALSGPAGPTSVVALQMLDYLAEESCRNSIPPVVTVGEGTLFVAGQDVVRHAYERTGRGQEGSVETALLIAPQEFPMTYAAGVSTIYHQQKTTNTVMLGRFGAEIGIMTEAAVRTGTDQIIGTDDPTAMAVATATTDHVLWGEELFAATAYLEGNATQLASVRTQDVLRWVVVVAIVISALLQLLGIL